MPKSGKTVNEAIDNYEGYLMVNDKDKFVAISELKRELREIILSKKDKTEEFETYADECFRNGFNKAIDEIADLFK